MRKRRIVVRHAPTYSKNGSENFLDHGDGLGVLGQNNSGLHVVALRVITCQTRTSEICFVNLAVFLLPVPPIRTSPPAAFAFSI